MASLGVYGDPDAWLHASQTMRTLAQQLEDELGTADGGGGSGLRPHWYGPVADAYQTAWQQRHQRYTDVISHAQRAAQATSDFGGSMIDFQQRAWDLERKWLEAGLHLTADGLRFMLPVGHHSLTQEVKSVFEALLGESERDIEAMWRDIDGAVHDLVTVLSAVLSELEDFTVLGGAGIAGAFGLLAAWEHNAARRPLDTLDRYVVDPLHDSADYLKEKVFKPIQKGAKAYDEEVTRLENRIAAVPDDVTGDLKLLRDDAVQAAKDARVIADQQVASADSDLGHIKAAGRGFLVATLVINGYETVKDIGKEGWVRGLEDNAGAWASFGAGYVVYPLAAAGAAALVAAAGVTVAPVVVAVGVAVVTGVVCVGVGAVVQHEVNSHRAAVTKAMTGISDAAVNAVTVPAAE